jgi:hypothetical protein
MGGFYCQYFSEYKYPARFVSLCMFTELYVPYLRVVRKCAVRIFVLDSFLGRRFSRTADAASTFSI